MKAVFLDRDGVINELIYYEEHGIIDSPFTVEQFRLIPGICETIKQLKEQGFRIVVISNQPGIAKRKISEETFKNIQNKMKEELAKKEAFLDGEYYCFHHPNSLVEELNIKCECRKPEPGLLLQAAQDMNIDLSQSWIIGDGLTDILAGKKAGCKTILLGRMRCELCHIMANENAYPDKIIIYLEDAVTCIKENGV
ncbi:D-glycero-alpha-D-manno-heptose-1,7-bisphosphate 7-phosphatase [Chloroflexota bacterium]